MAIDSAIDLFLHLAIYICRIRVSLCKYALDESLRLKLEYVM